MSLIISHLILAVWQILWSKFEEMIPEGDSAYERSGDARQEF